MTGDTVAVDVIAPAAAVTVADDKVPPLYERLSAFPAGLVICEDESVRVWLVSPEIDIVTGVCSGSEPTM